MVRTNQNSKGIYKQQLMRKEKMPTMEAKNRAEEWRFDDETIRVFVDASELDYCWSRRNACECKETL